MKVPYNDLSLIHAPLIQEFHESLDRALRTSNFVGDAVFAEAFKKYTGSKHCVTCNSGTDALYIAIKALELTPGSKIAVPAVSYAATAMAVVNAGHIPVFIDIDPNTGLMLTREVRDVDCVIPVHLYGQVVDIEPLLKLGIPIIEDCAQAHGTNVGRTGVIGCFSFYPGKNLGALGDAGACITDDQTLAINMKRYASLGSSADNKYEHPTDGINSRMDAIQGLFLETKLKHLDEWTSARRTLAKLYESGSTFPKRNTMGNDVYHVFYTLVDDRQEYINYMTNAGIQTGIHYPFALPNLKCFEKFYRRCDNATEFCKRCVSLPLFPGMTAVQIVSTLKCHKDYLRLRGV